MGVHVTKPMGTEHWQFGMPVGSLHSWSSHPYFIYGNLVTYSWHQDIAHQGHFLEKVSITLVMLLIHLVIKVYFNVHKLIDRSLFTLSTYLHIIFTSR